MRSQSNQINLTTILCFINKIKTLFAHEHASLTTAESIGYYDASSEDSFSTPHPPYALLSAHPHSPLFSSRWLSFCPIHFLFSSSKATALFQPFFDLKSIEPQIVY